MTVRRNVSGPTSLFEVLPDDVYNELVPQLKKDVGDLMLVSQRVYKACTKAQLGWTALLPERYRWVPNPRKIVIDAWKEGQNMKRDADYVEGYSLPPHEQYMPPSKFFLNSTITRFLRLTGKLDERMVSLLLQRARDSKSEITPSEVTQWVAIEMLITYAIERVEARSAHKNDRMQNMPLLHTGITALLAKDYLSPKLFHTLLRKISVVPLFFTLCAKRSLDDTTCKDIARFVLEKYFTIGLCECSPSDVEQLETWFGSELQELSTEYRIFGVQGLAALRGIIMPKMSEWKRFLLQSVWGPTDPREIPLSYLQSLVRVSKYIFHDPEQLVRFILSIVQEGREKVFLKIGGDTSSVDEFLSDFERRLKGMIEHVVEHDDAPFCPNPEYEKDRDFVDGALGPYLVEKFVRTTSKY